MDRKTIEKETISEFYDLKLELAEMEYFTTMSFLSENIDNLPPIFLEDLREHLIQLHKNFEEVKKLKSLRDVILSVSEK